MGRVCRNLEKTPTGYKVDNLSFQVKKVDVLTVIRVTNNPEVPCNKGISGWKTNAKNIAYA